MTLTLYGFTLWVHVFLAIIWVGGLLFIGWGVFPAVKILNYAHQRILLLSLMKHSHRYFVMAGMGVLVTGTLLGTWLGPIQSWDILWHTVYGQRWLAAFVVGIFTLCWGSMVGYRQAIKVLEDEVLWNQAEQGKKRDLWYALIKLALFTGVEGLGFVVLISLMLL